MWKRTTSARSALLLCSGLVLGVPFAGAGEIGGRVGAGVGLPYGSPLPGAGVEIELLDRLSVLGGISGYSASVAWSYGVRFYFHEPERKWRLHASAFRWLEGNGFYLGVDHDVGGPSGFTMTYGLGYGNVNLEGRVGATIGVGYRF